MDSVDGLLDDLVPVASYDDFAEILRRLRRRVPDLSLRQLEHDTGLSKTTLSEVLRGKRPPTARVLQRLIHAFRVTQKADQQALHRTLHKIVESERHKEQDRRSQIELDELISIHKEEIARVMVGLHQIAMGLAERGHLVEAFKIHEMVYVACSKHLGPRDRRTVEALRSLALVAFWKGDLDAARQMLEDDIDACSAIGTLEDVEDQQAILGRILAESNDLAGARGYQEQVYRSRRHRLGNAHPDTVAARNDLAETLERQGDNTTATLIRLHAEPKDGTCEDRLVPPQSPGSSDSAAQNLPIL